MSGELRIRNSRVGQSSSAWGADPPLPPDGPPAGLGPYAADGDPGEAAWNLIEPLDAQPQGDDGPAPRDEPRDEAPAFPGFPGMGGEEPEEAPKGPGLDIKRLARGIVKRIWLAAGIAFTIASIFLAIALTMVKPKWEATAMMMLHTRQDKFSLGGAKPFELQEYNLKTMTDTVTMPSSLQAVIDTLGLDVPTRTLKGAISLKTAKDTSIFQINVVWNDPVKVAAIANQVAGQLVQRSRDIRRKDAEEAHANYSAQLESTRRDLRTLTAELQAFKADHQVSDFGAETQVLLGSVSALESDLNTKTAEVQAIKEAYAEIEEAVKGEPEMVVTSTVYRNPLKTRLTDYEWQLQEARSRYTEQNPKVIKLQSRVDVLKAMIAESKDEGAPENLYSANTKLVDLQTRQRQLHDEVRIHEAQIGALTETIARQRNKLATLTSAEKGFQLVKARMAAVEKLEEGLVGRVDEARVMMLRNESGFDLLEPARPATEAAASPKKILVIAGVVLGGGIGLFVVLILELLDPLLRTRRDALGAAGVQLAWEFQHVPHGEHPVVDTELPADPVAILFRRMVNELDAALEPEDWRCLGFTSADGEAGRTLGAINLAQALALKEYPVVLVDADLRQQTGMRPVDIFQLPEDLPGMLQALEGEAPLSALLCRTETPQLLLLPAGTRQRDLALIPAPEPGPGSGTEAESGADAEEEAEWDHDRENAQPLEHGLSILGGRQFSAILDSLRQGERHLVYDLPPVSAQEAVVEAAATLGNLILVARSGSTTRPELSAAAQLLRARGAEVRGVLVTDVPLDLLEGRPLFLPKRVSKPKRRWFGRARKARVEPHLDPQPTQDLGPDLDPTLGPRPDPIPTPGLNPAPTPES